jgi:endothelin-converting enzyme/putative endopeptidase
MPAAVLQLPLFDAAGDPAVNYGALGSLIGHEIGHGFDDQGRRFDASGKLRDWWTPASAAQFDKRAAEIRRQYDAYEALPGLHVNGALTLGENIADLGGLEIAYAAYKRYVAVHGEPPVLDGLTGDQRFFLGFAEVTRAKVRPGFLRELVLRDPHSPPQFRANGPARNVDAWYAAFGVAPGDALYLPPEQRVRIW